MDDLLLHVDDVFSSGKKSGTKTRPHLIPVDIRRPDNNREFEIHHVQGLEAENGRYSHPGFEITLVVPPPDVPHWEAKVAHVPGYEKRTILIRGPSGGYFIRDPDMSKQYLAVCPHPTTAAAVRTHELDMANQEDCKYQYWMCIFPEGIELDDRLLAKATTDEGAFFEAFGWA